MHCFFGPRKIPGPKIFGPPGHSTMTICLPSKLLCLINAIVTHSNMLCIATWSSTGATYCVHDNVRTSPNEPPTCIWHFVGASSQGSVELVLPSVGAPAYPAFMPHLFHEKGHFLSETLSHILAMCDGDARASNLLQPLCWYSLADLVIGLVWQ